MKYHTLRMLLGINLLTGCLLFQGCGLMNKKSDADMASDIPGDGLGPVTVISDSVAVAAPVTPMPAVARPAPVVPARAMTTPYTVQKGDTVSGVAYRYYLRWQDVLAVNPGLDPKRLRIGQVIQLPGQVDLNRSRSAPAASATRPVTASPAKIEPPKVSAPAASGPATTYTVKKGDSLSVIAYKHGIQTSALRAANNLKSDRILVGQKLKIPGAATSAATAAKPAVKLPPPPVADASAKKAVESPPVKAGGVQEAVVEADAAAPAVKPVEVVEVEEPAPAPENLQTYTVKEGEDVYAVAIRWGVSPKEITALNNLKSIELEPGTVLKIPSVK